MHYYKFNVGYYVANTAHLSQAEDLAYRRLMDLYCLSENPPKGTIKQVARVIRMQDQLKAVSRVLTEYFEQAMEKSNGVDVKVWRNKHCDTEIEKYKSFSAAGRRGAEIRWKENADYSPPNSPIKPGYKETNSKKDRRVRKQELSPNKNISIKFDITKIQELDSEAWKRWVEYREDIGKPIKPASQAAAARKLADLGKDQMLSVEQSIAQGWQGIFPLKREQKKSSMLWSGMDKIDYTKSGNADGSF